MNQLVHPKERVYFIVCLVVSIIFYLLLIVSIVGIIYLIIGAIVGLILNGIFIGNLKGNSIKVSKHQFPKIHDIAQRLSKEMGLNKMPDIYVLQSGGALNAFAVKFLGRNFVVIYSDILELAYEEGEDALAFVICHELAHIKRKHLSNRWFIYPAMLVPFLGTAYLRACEYTCDMIGNYYVPNGAIAGLLVLTAGKKLYKQVNVEALLHQAQEEGGFWVWFAEIISTHPNIIKRVRNIINAQTSNNSTYSISMSI
ncbi:Protease HtpX [Fervidicola ferrireducens]|uniref:Protease HtpX n=1 Tax=Fervidicola ferrireducens TaxID=520764 RepID=A0A140L879_9FIRM|nr:M48 family metallopeptidase [Fervidicola ferrireducens]KXG76754.1 Protease HtpX [Fervidicola ferrireducens]